MIEGEPRRYLEGGRRIKEKRKTVNHDKKEKRPINQRTRGKIERRRSESKKKNKEKDIQAVRYHELRDTSGKLAYTERISLREQRKA